jgi:Complex I intermediate-associated protein 30 (CIA30)
MSRFSCIILCCAAAISSASAGPNSEEVSSDDNEVAVGEDRSTAGEENATVVMDFAEKSGKWRIINDGVMGGLSSSRFRIVKRVAVFEGDVSLENNGGFASVRSEPGKHDLSEAEGILIRVRGDGKRYAFRMRTTGAFDGISYEARFKTVAGEWKTIQLPFKAFRPVFRGRLIRDAAPLDPKLIKTFGILISDKQAGKFRLEIDWIKADRPSPEG